MNVGSFAYFIDWISLALCQSLIPNLVEYAQGTLLIQCPLGNFLAQVTPPASCGTYAQNLETQKIWDSQVQAALLSGKGLRFYFTICGGTNYIQVVDLFN